MTILVDMDDTIEQLLRAWLPAINRKFGRSVEYDDIKTWNMCDAYPGLSIEEIYAVTTEKGFWKTVLPMPGAPEALERLIGAGHEVYIVTATPYDAVRDKLDDVLFRWFPYLTWKQVILTANKQLVRGDVLIDDGVHNLEGGDYVRILMTAPHNRAYDAAANGMLRVNDWAEIERLIPRLLKYKGHYALLDETDETGAVSGRMLNPDQPLRFAGKSREEAEGAFHACADAL